MKHALLISLICFIGLSAFGEEINRNSQLNYSISTDADKNRSTFIDLDYYSNNKLHFIGSLGGTRSADVNSRDQDTGSLSLGLGYHFGPLFDGSVLVNYWGKKNVLSTSGISIPLNWTLKDWSFGLEPEFRELSITFQPMGQREQTSSIKGRALGVKTGYYGFYPLSLNFGFKKYSYGKDINLTKYPRLFNYLTTNYISLPTALVDSHGYVSITYDFSKFMLGIELSSSKSALDASLSETGTLLSNYYINNQWKVGLNLGASKLKGDQSDDTKIGFAEITVGYNWGS